MSKDKKKEEKEEMSSKEGKERKGKIVRESDRKEEDSDKEKR